jgi:methionyl-tRNA formyltransferase
MNLVFIGASQFGLRCLELACNLPDCKLTGVVTAPRKFAISYRTEGVTNVLYADIASFAEDRGLPCRTIGRSMNDPVLIETVTSWKPDAFLVAGWYHMVPRVWRELAPAYGLHASLLPDYSGGAPLVWAMINGESRTGITLYQMDDGVDTGPIVGQVEEVIEDRDTIATLYARIEERGLYLLREALPRLATGTAVLHAQPLTRRHVFPQRSPDDGWIDWTKDSQFIDRFVRAQTRPYPGAYAIHAGERILLWMARGISHESSLLPAGSVIHHEDRCSIVCGKGALQLEEIQINSELFVKEEILNRFPYGLVLESPAQVTP